MKFSYQLLRRRKFTAIVIGGGSPCQGNSSLNLHRKGLQDPRSQQPYHLQRLVRELRQVLAENHLQVPIAQFIENVGSAPADVVNKYSELTTGTPHLHQR